MTGDFTVRLSKYGDFGSPPLIYCHMDKTTCFGKAKMPGIICFHVLKAPAVPFKSTNYHEAKHLVAPCSVGNPRRCSCPPSLWALRYPEQLKSLAPDLQIEPDWRAGSGQQFMPTVAAAAASLKSLLPSYS